MTYSIVRKRMARSPLMYSPYAKRARTAYALGSYAYRNRAKIRWAARKIGRAYRRSRSKKSFKPSSFGERVGTSTAKRWVSDETDLTSRDTRTLYAHSISDISQGTALNQRERNIVNCRGYKICLELQNRATTALYVNVAVLVPKDGVASSVGSNNFFRSSGSIERSRNFDITLNSVEFHCLPINVDKYTILKHKRYRLVAGAASANIGQVALSGRSYCNIDWWIPINRQLRYNADTGQPISGGAYLVYWTDSFGAASGTSVVLDQWDISRRVIAYYKEPKN